MKPKIDIKIEQRDGKVTFSSKDDVDPKVLYKLGMTAFNQQRFAQLAPDAFGFTPDLANKADFIRLGEALWKETYAHGDEDHVAGQKLIDWADRQPPDFADFFRNLQNSLVWFATARWADQAFPTVTMGEKFCAALLATQIPEDMAEEIEAPWKAFMIEVPGKMLSVFDGDLMQRTRIARILVHKTNHPEDPWRWIAFGEMGQHVWRTGHADQLLKPVQFKKNLDTAMNYSLGDKAFDDDLHRDERLYILISRLVLNVCLMVADPDQVKLIGSSHKRHKAREGRHGPPEQRVFQIGRPINLDCRDAIQEYVEGERTARELKVQSLTRGYYRRQPHGPKLSLRRRQWIEPYWRGPEDAPILLRPHVIPEDSG
jgi:hypothetical protein